MGRVIDGIDVDTLPDQFSAAVAGRTLILDGDGPCYVASATVKRLDTALRRFQQEVLKLMFMTGAEDCRIHLTARDSDKHGRFRVKAAKPYQGNRKGKAKPALLEPLRELVTDNSTWLNEYTVMLHKELEADDGMIQDAYRLKEDGVICSEDKDLRMTPYPYYAMDRGQVMASQSVGFLTMKHTDGGTPKCLGQGPLFFWAQMLMGDGADNIAGIKKLNDKLCGPTGAYGALKDCTNINDAANFVIENYRKIGQNVVAEAWLLWLTRFHGDNCLKYFDSLALTPENAAYIQECLTRDWVMPRVEKERHEPD